MSSQTAFPINCKRWSCPACGPDKARLASLVIEAGLEIAREADQARRFLVLTSPACGMSVPEFRAAWTLLRRALSYGSHYESYARTVEVKSGKPHLNLVTVGGRSISYLRLREIAVRSGFGQVVHVRAVQRSERDSELLARYVVKSPLETVRWAGHTGFPRFRPVQLSQNWRPFRLTEARKQLRDASGLRIAPGPFLVVRAGGTPAVLGPGQEPQESFLEGLK